MPLYVSTYTSKPAILLAVSLVSTKPFDANNSLISSRVDWHKTIPSKFVWIVTLATIVEMVNNATAIKNILFIIYQFIGFLYLAPKDTTFFATMQKKERMRAHSVNYYLDIGKGLSELAIEVSCAIKVIYWI